MRIVFGHNNFLIKRYNAADLGVPSNDESVKGLIFEVRQHYFHLFWIPFFGIGKIYAFRRPGDSNLYKMPDEIKALIISKHGHPRTPWYTFALPLLGLLGLTIFWISEWQQKQRWESNFYETAAERKGYIQYPTTGDYYKLTLNKTQEDNYETRREVYLKVAQYSDDKIEMVTLFPDLNTKTEDHVKYYFDLSSAIEAFDTAARFNYNRMAIPKKALMSAVDTVYHGADQPPVYIEELKAYCQISEMKRRDLD